MCGQPEKMLPKQNKTKSIFSHNQRILEISENTLESLRSQLNMKLNQAANVLAAEF